MSLPTEWANYLSMLGFVVLLLIVWRIPKHLVYAEAKDKAAWRDIRWWATLLIAIQLILYLTFS